MLNRRFLGCLLSLALAVGLTACEDKTKPAGGETPTPTPTDDKKPGSDQPGEDPGQDAAAPTSAHPECVGPLAADGPKAELDIGGLKYERSGAVLTLKTPDDDDEYTIGQLTDVKDFTPENKANLEVAVKWFKDEKVDAIAVTGDLGESVDSIYGVLKTAASVGVPVLAIAGNRECRAHFTEALTKASAEMSNVINMNTVRVFNADDVSIVSLPGYYNRSYIHCAEGCEYFPSDVKALDEAAKLTTAPARVLLSHGPPKMDGATGLDRIHEEVNVGDPELADYLKGGAYPFGLFGNIQEAGGYGTDLSGANRVQPDVFADQLYLNPGPIDAVRWAMLDGTESLGMAGLLKVKGKQAKYKVYRIRAGEAKVEP